MGKEGTDAGRSEPQVASTKTLCDPEGSWEKWREPRTRNCNRTMQIQHPQLRILSARAGSPDCAPASTEDTPMAIISPSLLS